MGKHAGQQDLQETTGPYGPGPHPTPEQSEQAGKDFDAQIAASAGGRRDSDK